MNQRLTTDQFEQLVTALVSEINRVQQGLGYDLEISKDGKECRITPRTNVLYTHYFCKWEALTTIYDISYWIEVIGGKPCIRIFNEQ